MLLPCAATNTLCPDLMSGTIVSFQYGNTRSRVSFKLSVVGILSAGIVAAQGDLEGWYGWSNPASGGGVS